MTIVIPIKASYLANKKNLTKSHMLADFRDSADPVIIKEAGQTLVSNSIIKGSFFSSVKNSDDIFIELPDQYSQFKDIVETAVEHHYAKGYSTDDVCILQVEQSLINTGTRRREGLIHVDGYSIEEEHGFSVMGEDNYLATSALSPLFFNGENSSTPASIEEVQHKATQHNVSSIMHEFFEKVYDGVSNGVSYGNHTLVNFSGIKPHISAQATEDTLKTLVVVRFLPS